MVAKQLVPTGAISDLVDRILAEGPIGLSDVCGQIGEFKGARPHVSTPLRWIMHGVSLSDGTRVKLEGIRIAGRWVTSRPALCRFLAAQQQAVGLPQPARSPSERGRASERAAKALEAAGI